MSPPPLFFLNETFDSLDMEYIYESYPVNRQLTGRWSPQPVELHEVAEPHIALLQLAPSPPG